MTLQKNRKFVFILDFLQLNSLQFPCRTPPSTWKLWTQRRYVLTFLVFCGYFNIYALRVNMSIGIVAMTQNQVETLENGTEISLVSHRVINLVKPTWFALGGGVYVGQHPSGLHSKFVFLRLPDHPTTRGRVG